MAGSKKKNNQPLSLEELDQKANQIRQDIIKMLVEAASGHSAGPLGMADVFTALYFGGVQRYDPAKPDWENRDRVVLSCGHICPVLYATLAHARFFPHDELLTLRKINTRLQGHPHAGEPPGVEITSGPLGQGLSQAVGMALAAKIDNSKRRIFCVTSDGEHDEGQTWEAIMLAAKYRLSNLTTFIDRNNIQIDGYTEDVMPLEPLLSKYQAFNWHVVEVDGHNIEAILDAINLAKAIQEKPTAIICHTIPGKGVEFMEGMYQWHGKPPNKEEARKAIHDLRTLGGKIISEHE